MFSVGIVGCGGIAQVHAAALARIEGVKLAACADVKPARADRMAADYGCRAYASLDAMLDAEALDALHICTPHYLHTPMAEAAARRGIAVFTEKPPVIDRAQWRRLEAVAERVPLGICFQNRYNGSVRAAREILRSGEFGAPVGARAFVTWSRGAAYYHDSGWRGAWATEGGGALINQSIHTLDLLIWLLGGARRVEARLSNHHLRGAIEVEDTVEAYLEPGGHPALFYASTAYTSDAPIFLEIQLERAVLRITGDALDVVADGSTRHVDAQTASAPGKDYWGSGHLPCIADFYRSLGEGAPYQNDLASVRDTMDAVLRIYEQAGGALGRANA